MDNRNPYRAPGANLSTPMSGAVDATGPFSPAGRFGRLSYIAWGMLMGIAVQLAMFAIGGSALFMPGFDAAGNPVPPDVAPLTLAIILGLGLASLVISILFVIRRLHDVDACGWWSLLALVPLVNIGFFLFVLFKAGTPGANNYGPPRVTRGWEKVVGIIGVVLMVIGLIGVIAAIAIPAYMSATGQLPPMEITPQQ